MPDITDWFLVFARAGALLAVFPITSSQNVPVRFRIGLGAALAFLISPLLPTASIAGASTWTLVSVMIGEACVGLLLGFLCRLLFFALDLAGGLVATEMGLMLSAQFNPLNAASVAAPGMLFHWLGIMLLFSLDMHHWLLAAFQRSYTLVPAGAAHMSTALLDGFVAHTAKMFVIAIQISAPIMAVSFVVTLIFALLSRAVPQMNTFAESFPVRTLAGLAVLGATCTLMAQHIGNYVRRLPEDMMRLAQLLGAG